MFGCYNVSILDLRFYRLTMLARHVDVTLTEYYTAIKVPKYSALVASIPLWHLTFNME